MKAFLLILLFSQLIYGEDEFITFSFINDSDEKRFYSLQNEVSCPLCEGSSIAVINLMLQNRRPIIYLSLIHI